MTDSYVMDALRNDDVERLIRARVSTMIHDDYILDDAIWQNALNCAAFLLEEKASINGSDHDKVSPPLVRAVRCQNVKAVKLLLDAKANPNRQALGKECTINVAINGPKGNAILDSMLQAKADINIPIRREGTPLHHAVRWQDLQHVSMLLERKADPNTFDDFGKSPLHSAINRGTCYVEALLANGANANLKPPGGSGSAATSARSIPCSASDMVIQAALTVPMAPPCPVPAILLRAGAI